MKNKLRDQHRENEDNTFLHTAVKIGTVSWRDDCGCILNGNRMICVISPYIFVLVVCMYV